MAKRRRRETLFEAMERKERSTPEEMPWDIAVSSEQVRTAFRSLGTATANQAAAYCLDRYGTYTHETYRKRIRELLGGELEHAGSVKYGENETAKKIATYRERKTLFDGS